jgi:hypothetical protein
MAVALSSAFGVAAAFGIGDIDRTQKLRKDRCLVYRIGPIECRSQFVEIAHCQKPDRNYSFKVVHDLLHMIFM